VPAQKKARTAASTSTTTASDATAVVPAQPAAQAVETAPVVATPTVGYATAPVLPQVPVIKGKSYASPLSFIGSARRIGAAINRVSGGNVPLAVFLWVLGVMAIALAWTFVALWYVVIFGLFGIFTFPFRLMRRSQRKSQHLQQVSLATQQAMLLQQQQQLLQRNGR
jgi:hypothetical protein